MSGASILLATRNDGKLRELRALFARAGMNVTDLETFGLPEEEEEEDALEAFATFEENALAKARYFYEVSGGIPTVADDSGLEVAALGGAPGVHSKRYSKRRDLRGAALDAANNAELQRALSERELGNVPVARDARFVCAAAYVGLGVEIVRHGEVAGVILREPRGSGGFGYDPYFQSTELGRTLAESDIDAKERVGHRGRAFTALLAALRVGV